MITLTSGSKFSKPEGAYLTRHKIKPFLAGLLEGSPLVEVAIEGLKRPIADDLRREYELRVARHGNTEQIHAAMLAGCSNESQDMLAAAFEHKYNLRMNSEHERAYTSESGMHASVVLEISDRYKKHTLGQIVRLLKSGKVSADKAQMTFASMIFAEGSAEQASELLTSGKVSSMFARHVLRFKLGEHGGYDA
ncbi:MAG: hypothetical protein U0R44_06330 [Candidatus Micrarchaeia archaeon]